MFDDVMLDATGEREMNRPLPEFDMESWAMCKKLRDSRRRIIRARRAPLLSRLAEIEGHLRALQVDDEDLDRDEELAWQEWDRARGLVR